MLHFIARILDPLLRFLLPATGHRRRTAQAHHPAPCSGAPRAAAPRIASSWHESLPRQRPQERAPLVRPYLLAHEQRTEARHQRARRRQLWLAVHGIDVGPRLIHGVEVAS